MAAVGALHSALEPWAVKLTPEGIAAFEQSGAVTPSSIKEYVLSADLRRLHMSPHIADPTNFPSLLNKSQQASAEVAAWAAANETAACADASSLAFNYSLKNPLLCMVLAFQDLRLPTKDVEEDFSGGVQGIAGNQKRLLSLKLTDGRGTSFAAIELRFCPQLDAVPLLPGVKLLLLPGLVLYRGMALLLPQCLRNLGGGAGQLREAFNLKADVQERRKQLQHILKENTELQQRIKADKEDTGPPKFVPFSAAAKAQTGELSAMKKTVKDAQQQLALLPREVVKRNPPSQQGGKAFVGPASQPPPISVKTGDLKLDRLRQQEKVSPNIVGADKIGLEPRCGRGGRGGRRGRREREEELSEYLRPSGRPVTYSLFDLIKADAEQTNSSAATALLLASEPYANESSRAGAASVPDPSFPAYPSGARDELCLGFPVGSRGPSDAPQRGHRGRPSGRGGSGRGSRFAGRERGGDKGRAAW